MSKPNPQKVPPAACPLCAYEFEGDELLRSLEPPGVEVHADGGQQAASGDFRYQCPGCSSTLTMPQGQAATLLIEKQTRELFSSITAALRGSAKSQ